MAKDKEPASEVVERAVRFRFNQHCFLPDAEGSQGEERRLPPDVAQRLKERQIGDVIPEEVVNE